jgi:lipopolysaccharide biosynthesis glycosyltransferase
MRIVCAVEGEAYVRHGAAMLHSLLAIHQDSVQIDYLHGDDTSTRGRKRLATMVDRMGGQIQYHRVPDSWVEGLPVKGFTRKATWYRIFLTRLLPDADRAIYLDLDLLVLDSLLPLWRTPLDGNLLGAVTNVPPGPDRYRERPELGDDPYFNAGVLLLDLDAMRRSTTCSTTGGFTSTHGGTA